MGDEGELKKPILKLIKDLAKDDEHYFAAEDIVNLKFDEAKKDMLGKSFRDKVELVGEKDVIRPDFICIEYKKWEKWLGDSS